jgi:hypothetical protein
MPPRDYRMLLGLVLEAAADPDTPTHLKVRIAEYLKGPAGLSSVMEALEQPSDEKLAELVEETEPQVMARRAEKMLLALAAVMPNQMSLRQVIAFVMIARSTLQGHPMTIAGLQSKAGLDAKGKPILGTSITNTKESLSSLLKLDRQDRGNRGKPIRLNDAGRDLIHQAIARLQYAPGRPKPVASTPE